VTTPLHLIWLSSWVLAAGSAVGMGCLVAGRLWRTRADARRRRARASVTEAYLGVMAGRAEGLARLGRRRADPSLLAAALLEVLAIVRGGDRDRLVEALGAWGLDRRLRSHLDRGPIHDRLATVEALGVFPDAPNESALRAVLAHGVPALRLAAAKSLLQMNAPIDVVAFVHLVEERRDPRSAALADVFRLLAERQPDECAGLLLDPGVAEPLRVMLAEALGASSDYAVLPIVEAAALEGASAVRAAALKTLGRLMHPAAERAVARGIADGDPQVRAAAAAAAGAAGLVRLTPALADCLQDSVWTVRFQAAEALTRLGAGGVSRLREAVQGANGEAARIASLTLAERRL
jgi:HEAT repeat protein